MTQTNADWSRAVVIGASSGIGAALARELTARGNRVAVVARRGAVLTELCAEINAAGGTETAPRAVPFVHDVTETAAVPTLFQEIALALGGLDLVIYAAGVLPSVGPDAYPTDDDLRMLRINLEGAVAWLNEAAQRFAVAGAGTIVGISSVAGDRGRRANPVYQAAKAGLNVYLESLRCRLAVRGVTVVTIKPGYVRTPMLEGQKTPRFLPVGEPDVVAREILDSVARKQRVVYVPGYWRWVMQVVRALPAALMERINL